MIKIGITKKFQEKLGVGFESIEKLEIDRFYSWHANTFQDSRRTGIIFMNDLTRFCVILFGLKKSDFKNLIVLFSEQFKRNMLVAGFSEKEIEDYLKHVDEWTFVKTSSRSVMGGINDCLRILPHWMDLPGMWDYDKITFINDKFNGMPMSPLKKDGFEPFPKYAMRKVINQWAE